MSFYLFFVWCDLIQINLFSFDDQAKVHKNFWDCQAQELRQGRFDERQFDRDLLNEDQRKEMETEDDLVNPLAAVLNL